MLALRSRYEGYNQCDLGDVMWKTLAMPAELEHEFLIMQGEISNDNV